MKRFFVFFLISSFCCVLSAQMRGDKGLRFGLQLTPTISWMTSDETALFDPDGAVMGYSYGAVVDWFFSENYAVASGFYMNNVGGKVVYGDDMPLELNTDGPVYLDGRATMRMGYLEVPIGVKFFTKEFWRTKFIGQIGYNQFFLVNAKVRHDGDYDKKDVSEEFSSVNTAYHFGFGAEYALGGSSYLTASVLAVLGLSDVTKSESTTDGVDPNNKLSSINFKVGVIF